MIQPTTGALFMRCVAVLFLVLFGNLVKTLHHNANRTECAWNQITESNQLIYAGV